MLYYIDSWLYDCSQPKYAWPVNDPFSNIHVPPPPQKKKHVYQLATLKGNPVYLKVVQKSEPFFWLLRMWSLMAQ